jgi:hypothetical protein
MLTASRLVGALYPRQAWVWAFAVDSWIPLFGIVVGRLDYASLLALVLASLGAYAGAFAGKWRTLMTGCITSSRVMCRPVISLRFTIALPPHFSSASSSGYSTVARVFLGGRYAVHQMRFGLSWHIPPWWGTQPVST